ncbi:uncharacterized protein LOC112568826 [Pomacea canaliculata]|uniref:uncharacterized protein LOC112568826 n=1 Tax=Pomacea canaliculata TaxID=400727 RepID=UPI000D73E14F|nr:uncharacterized protein LOC112568826 [Pomacea canaliculata]
MNYRFKCVDVPANYYVAWLITRQDPSNGNQLTNTDVCSMTDDRCHSYSEGSGAIRVNNITSILFFYPSVINDIIGITCRVFDKELARTLSYINDYTCSITLLDTPKMDCVLQATHHGSRRTVLCTITNIVDLTQDYQCEFTEELEVRDF